MKRYRMNRIWVVLALVGLLLTTSGVPPVLAASGVRQETPTPDRLSEALAREQQALSRLEEHFARAEEAMAKTQEAIGYLQSQAVDTASLEEALASFQAAVDDAHSAYAQAADTLAAHVGFDANGQVTDPEQALQTVRAAGEALQQARHGLAGAAREFRQAVRAFRQSLREQRLKEKLAQRFAGVSQALGRLGGRYEQVDQIIARVEERMADLQAQGVDTAPLEEALAAFRQGVETSRSQYEQASSVLTAHAGFDENGQVTDIAQAQQTLMDGRQALRQAWQTLQQAAQEFRQVVRDFLSGLQLQGQN